MKLVFKKDEESQIKVSQKVDGAELDYSYIDMIKSLIETRVMERPEISDDFTEAEIKSINSMISFINKEISATEQPGSTE
jgi:hypothetical protein